MPRDGRPDQPQHFSYSFYKMSQPRVFVSTLRRPASAQRELGLASWRPATAALTEAEKFQIKYVSRLRLRGSHPNLIPR